VTFGARGRELIICR